ncbi:Uncharacterised protein [Vibrio cholerae]|nr:Uncharacterised protein [Vibrio cholerae]CSI34102.1 Uncharacterised protein [Vibrio cholerae]CSI67815.1 Uncharacterised protein [Vibrio cholerae]
MKCSWYSISCFFSASSTKVVADPVNDSAFSCAELPCQ